ncbi:hypothetical protein [Flavobacterium sp.]|uniref:hypothetical protein n=1 Tax=Flavobacterium sp. TaxID=239 RepID=UPI0038FC6702
MSLQIKDFISEKEDHFLDARKSKNVHLTSLVDRLIFNIKIDIKKIFNLWIVTNYGNIITLGVFRYSNLFFEKGPSGCYRRIFSPGVYGNYLVWCDEKDKKVLSFQKYIICSTD